MNLNPVGSSPNVGQMPAQTNPSKSMQSPVTEIATKALKGNEDKAKSTLGNRFVTWLKNVGAAIRRLFSCCVAKEKGGRLPNPSNSTPNSRASSSDSLPPLVPVTPDSSIPNPPPPPGSNPPPPSGNPPPPPPPPLVGTPGGRIPTVDSNSNASSPAPSPAAKKGHQKNDSAALLNSSQDLQKKIEERRKKLEELERNKPQENSPVAAQTPPPRSNSAPVTPAAAPKKQAMPAPSSQKKPASANKSNPTPFDPTQVSRVVLRKSPRATPVNTQTSQENVDPVWAAKQAALKAKAENQDQDQ
ncbi:MAG: hypothetical protein BGO14_11090 [Chlamydiales bacterium 38-26]|nr:hypothetical protein [Chlamydiales bacterium]OJV11495.1 MAG: hypothetical protein BGO14_11090 [Chlamydiales bacterium 38-26]